MTRVGPWQSGVLLPYRGVALATQGHAKRWLHEICEPAWRVPLPNLCGCRYAYMGWWVVEGGREGEAGLGVVFFFFLLSRCGTEPRGVCCVSHRHSSSIY